MDLRLLGGNWAEWCVCEQQMKGYTQVISLTPKVGGGDPSHSPMVIMTLLIVGEDLIMIAFFSHIFLTHY